MSEERVKRGMKAGRLAMSLVAAVVALGATACSQGGENVMAQEANALTPAQVDAALGPEIGNEAVGTVNEALEDNALETREAVEAAEGAEPSRPARPQGREETDTNQAEPSQPAEEAPADNGTEEQ